MVTKTISINDEIYDRIREISQENEKGFSQVVTLLLKRGLAYSQMLDEQKGK